MSPRYHIPFFQPLPPRYLVAGHGDLPRTFPFSAPHIRHYYLARNAIWYGVDALGLKPGDGVLMPAYHHGVDLEVILAKGLRPRFYRVDERTEIDLEDLQEAMIPGIKALYVIHYFGFPQPVEKLRKFAKEHGLLFIEDCALSLFSEAPEGMLGSFGDIGIFCLYKTLPLPHGGTLVMNRPGLPEPPPTKRPDRMSTVGYLAHLMLDYVGLYDGPGPRLASLGKHLGRATKRALNAETTAIDTNELDHRLIPVGMGRATKFLLARAQASDVIRIRRRNFEHLSSILDPRVRPLYRSLPEGVCPLSLPLIVKDKERVHAELLADGVGCVNFWSRARPEVPMGAFTEVAFLRKHVMEVPIHQGLEPKHIEFIAEHVSRRARW